MIQQFRPSVVASFSAFYAEMALLDLSAFDLSSVSYWISTGDASHQAHIKKIMKVGHYYKNGSFAEGSCYLDTFGSSEMASALFRILHTPETQHPLRCIGQPFPWVEGAILNEFGEKLKAFTIGKLAVKSPTTTYYWNNSSLTFSSYLSGYFLTGDIAYQDEQGRFYQIDRVTDVSQTLNGLVYSTLTEEIILYHFPEIIDCTVVGLTLAIVVFDGDNSMQNILLSSVNDVLKKYHQAPLENIYQITKSNLPVGATGKVLKRVLREKTFQHSRERANVKTS